MYQYEPNGQLTMLDMASCGEIKKAPRPRAAKPDSELIAVPYFHLDLSPDHVDLFGNHYWELRSPWREGKPPLNTGVAPRVPIRASLSDILEPNPDPKYYLTTTACLGILRRAENRGKELPKQLKAALMVQAGLTDEPYKPSGLKAYHINQRDEGIDLNGVSGALMATNNMQMQTFVTRSEPPTGFDGYNGDLTGGLSATLGVNCGMSTGRNGVIAPIAFAANQRDEVRDLRDIAGALGAQPGMKQQTFIAKGCLTSWDTQQQRVFTPDGVAPTLAGADGGGGRNPAGLLFAEGVAAKGNGDCVLCLNDQGGQRMDVTANQTSTLRAQMGGHQPLICLNDQGGKVMSCSEDISGTLRAQEHGHQPLVMNPRQKRQGNEGLVYTGNILQGNFCESKVAGAQMANQNKCYSNLVMPHVFGQQSYAHYAEGVSPLAATGGTLGGGGENLVVNDPPMLFGNHGIDSRYTGPHPVSPTLSARAGTGGNNVPLVSRTANTFCITGNAIDRQPQNGGNGIGYQEDIAYTLTATDHHAVFSRQRADAFRDDEVASTQSARQHRDATDLVCKPMVFGKSQYGNYSPRCATLRAQGGDNGGGSENLVATTDSALLIRRLTPLECERLQGFPDLWTEIVSASDSARYKALGNSVAIPCVEFIMLGLSLAAGDPHVITQTLPACEPQQEADAVYL